MDGFRGMERAFKRIATCSLNTRSARVQLRLVRLDFLAIAHHLD
jgi:hypothetical protein